MKSPAAISLALAVALAGFAHAVEEGSGAFDAERWRRRDLDFFRAYYTPVNDPQAGRLYEPALELLEKLRELPEEIWIYLDRDTETAEHEHDSDEALRGEGHRIGYMSGWVTAVYAPAGDLESMAYSFFAAGRYEEALSLYERMLERRPDEAHYMVMAAHCMLKAGRREDALETLKRAAEEYPDVAAWIKWTVKADRLAEALGRPKE